MAGNEQYIGPDDTDQTARERKRRSGVLPGLVLLAAFLLVAWLIWTYAQRPDVRQEAQSPATTTATQRVPDVVGLTEDEAVRVLSEAGFSVEADSSSDVLAEVGSVATQDPRAGAQATSGSVVVIAVVVESAEAVGADGDSEADDGGTSVPGATGRDDTPRRVRVPRVLGLSESAAINKLEAAGLDPRPMYQPYYLSIGKVYQQDPAPGTKVDSGRKVFVLIGRED